MWTMHCSYAVYFLLLSLDQEHARRTLSDMQMSCSISLKAVSTGECSAYKTEWTSPLPLPFHDYCCYYYYRYHHLLVCMTVGHNVTIPG